jgi:hypothetical protein
MTEERKSSSEGETKMKKILAIGALLLSASAVMVTPAAAATRFREDYRYPAYTYESRLERLRAERLERRRLERLRRERERLTWMMRHRAWDRH